MRYSIAHNLVPGYCDGLTETIRRAGVDAGFVECFVGFPKNKTSHARFYRTDISEAEFCETVKRTADAGFGVNYLMNSVFVDPCSKAFDEEVGMISKLGIRTVTVATEKVARAMATKLPEARVVVSICADVDSVEKAAGFLACGNVTRIVLPTRLNRDFRRLTRLIPHLAEHNVETEALANDLCLPLCRFRASCVANGSSHGKAWVKSTCKKGGGDIDVITEGGWIRPEDVAIYEKVGVAFIKISDRDCDTALITRALAAYLDGRYSGNFFDLMNLGGRRVAGGRIERRHLDNRKLDGFIMRGIASLKRT